MAGNYETDYTNILQNTPIAVIDSVDVIVWSTRNSGGHPLLPVGSSIRDLVPELDNLLGSSCPSYALVNISDKAISTNSFNPDDNNTIFLMKFDYSQMQKDSTALENIMFQMILDSPYEGMPYRYCFSNTAFLSFVSFGFKRYIAINFSLVYCNFCARFCCPWPNHKLSKVWKVMKFRFSR